MPMAEKTYAGMLHSALLQNRDIIQAKAILVSIVSRVTCRWPFAGVYGWIIY